MRIKKITKHLPIIEQELIDIHNDFSSKLEYYSHQIQTQEKEIEMYKQVIEEIEKLYNKKYKSTGVNCCLIATSVQNTEYNESVEFVQLKKNKMNSSDSVDDNNDNSTCRTKHSIDASIQTQTDTSINTDGYISVSDLSMENNNIPICGPIKTKITPNDVKGISTNVIDKTKIPINDCDVSEITDVRTEY
eukprot:CAMPEP_0116899222 /NCGR_PEP_ID=MMETSP0467-20121206/7843_1 /TAXON_ID=283647 /ORGANISM="Mesodinium pulex, Strain SPMC105" /LENGTH=189 /DNA_ID=CAMNT_0004571931 /DNA_START=1257 /DNA_END=1826 /DNA_ORIENTATION=-